jgi:glycosyltransferase involved in cell wall biosynthesis
MPPISVLIATRDRPRSLARCLSSVLANDYGDFDVVVVDQSSTDASEDIVRTFDDVRLWYRRLQTRGLSSARNAAIEESTGRILAFTDDDCTVSPDWLRRIAEVFSRDAAVGIIFGTFQAVAHDPREFYVPSFAPARYRRLQGRWDTRCNDHEAGGNMAIRRDVLTAVGPFDPCLCAGGTFFSGEDSDFNNRVLRAGFAVVHDPESVVLHWGMRAYADGSARRLLLDGSLARGALLAKELRCRNPIALYIVARLLLLQGAGITINLLLRRQPTGAGQLLCVVRGFYRGLRHPLDHHRQLFLQD